MLSGVVIVSPSGVPDTVLREGVARSLAALVPACVSGLLGDVSLAAQTGDADLAAVADHAGCRLVVSEGAGAALGEAVSVARHQAILVLRAGTVPAGGYQHELESLLTAGIAKIAMRTEPCGLLQRLAPRLCPPAMVVASRQDLASVAGTPDAADLRILMRRLRPFRELSARALPVAGFGQHGSG